MDKRVACFAGAGCRNHVRDETAAKKCEDVSESGIFVS